MQRRLGSPGGGPLLQWFLLAALQRRYLAVAGSPAEATEHTCPMLDDSNGRWEGSRAVGGKYTLRCVPGFQVSGRQGYQSGTLTCPDNLEWPEELKCEDVDNCDQLEHGCGPKGICVDLVDGYDCNCEKGYPRRRSRNGEIVCGDEADMDICGGNTCGAYGLCIDLKSSAPPADASGDELGPVSGHAQKQFQCECADGFVDNGTTCLRRDCGALHDELGAWTGSTLFNQEYTLECPESSFVWGYMGLRNITIRCTRKGHYLAHPVCHSPALDARDARDESLRFWISLGCVFLCICSAALAAGLTLGMATLEPFGLTVVMATSEEHCRTREAKEKLRRDQVNAELVLPLVRDHHRLLVTLMLFNTIANESLPIFLDELVPSWAAVLISVTAVLICGEILPSAIFTGPSQMRIAGTFVPFVRLLQWLFHYVSKPIIAMLDRLIEHEDSEGGAKYSRAELRALLQLHGQQAGEEEAHAHGTTGPPILAASELRLVDGALGLQDRPLDEVPYTKRRQCALGSGDSGAADVLLDLLGSGQRAVLVLSAAAEAPPPLLRRVTTGSLRCPLVAPREVVGCLNPRDLLLGGHRPLGSLCAEPLVLVPDWLTALEALRLLATGGSSLGVVIHGTEEEGAVQGVVSRAELLGAMLRTRSRPCVGPEPQALAEPCTDTPVHGTGRRRVGHRALLTRTTSTTEPGRGGVLRRTHSRSATLASAEGGHALASERRLSA
mmetsp:Transcript_43762/g.136209  ORF Transcript_43762/g.136209 Transcript_43762/m.136209 type:complete len:725 (+) Transcript_43762:33-2207(+)